MEIEILSSETLTEEIVLGIVELQKRGWEKEDTLYRRRFDPEYMFGMWKKAIGDGIGFMAVLRNGRREIIGIMAGIMGPDMCSGQRFAVESMWRVSSEAKGYGRRLLQLFETWAKENSCEIIIMKCIRNSRENEIARKYERAGYAVSGTEFVKEV